MDDAISPRPRRAGRRAHAARTVDNSAAYLAAHLRPGIRVLDVGCGPGSITLDLAQRVAPGEVIGVDSAADVIDRATQAAESTGDRVTRPGGLVAARDADYEAMTWAPATTGLTRWLELYRSAARGTWGEPDAGRHLLRWAHEAGLSGTTASASVWCFADDEAGQWWGGQWQRRTVESGFHDQVIAQGVADEGEIALVVEGWQTWTDSPDGWFVIVHGEILARV